MPGSGDLCYDLASLCFPDKKMAAKEREQEGNIFHFCVAPIKNARLIDRSKKPATGSLFSVE
jgi:hypothetical protein